MLTFITLTARYDSSYAVSTIRSNNILSLHLPQGLPLYIVDVVAPVPEHDTLTMSYVLYSI
jgi:hypothetical protein